MLFVSVGMIVSILFTLTDPNQSQDLRRGASGEDVYQLELDENELQIAKKNADGVGINALLFKNGFLETNQRSVVYTWQIANPGIATITTRDYTGTEYCPHGVAVPCPALHIDIVPQAVGETTITVSATVNGLPVGQATTSVVVAEKLPDNKNSLSIPYEDFYFPSESAPEVKIFTENDLKTEVESGKLTAGKRYWAQYRIVVNNRLKQTASQTKDTVTIGEVFNDHEGGKDIGVDTISSTLNGYTVESGAYFEAKTVNTFQLIVDSKNRFRESNENNNTFNTEIGGTAKEKSYNTCNQQCSSNAECDAGLTCHEVDGTRRCRLPTNTSSTSCSTSGSTTSGTKSCNQSCANSAECSTGLTCWYNRCRQPGFLDSTSCSTTQTQAATTPITGCNQACAGNRDCSAGLRCYQNTCRYPLNLVSTSCSPQSNETKGGVTGTTLTIPTATARPSSSPVATATPTTATTAAALTTPTPQPTVQPQEQAATEETAFDSIAVSVGQYLNSLFSSETTGSIPLPLIIIGLGILFLVIAVIIIIVSSLRRTAQTTVVSTPSSVTHSSDKPAVPASAHSLKPPFVPAGPVTPPPAPEMLLRARQHLPQQQSVVTPPLPPQPALQTITPPPPQPQQAVAPTLPISPPKPGSLVERLKQKGITVPQASMQNKQQ